MAQVSRSGSGFDFKTLDLYSDESLLDPYPFYEKIREAGSAVWLEMHKVWAVARYADVRSVTSNFRTFISGEGLALTPESNAAMKGSVLASDPPEHTVLRGVLKERLSNEGIQQLEAEIQKAADKLIAELVEKESFDTVPDLAQAFPQSIVIDLIGVSDEIRPKLLGWADGAFNSFGPANKHLISTLPQVIEMTNYARSVGIHQLKPGSLGRAIFEAGERGTIRPEQCGMLLMAYLSAGLDTTINSIAFAVKLFAEEPEQWDKLRENPDLVKQAFDEIVRLETPVRAFTRVASEATQIGDQDIAKSDRVLVMFAAANRDPRKYANPERFDIMRAPADHLGFGVGRHLCAGQVLAQLEARSLLQAMIRRIKRFEIGESIPHLNNGIRGLASLPTRVIPS